MSVTHVAITPAKNEAENLPRLARSLADQTAPLSAWIVVDNGSTDDTVAVVEALARDYPWIRLVHVEGEGQSARGRMSVRAFNAGYDLVEQPIDVVSNVDADVSLPPTYFESLLGRLSPTRRSGSLRASATRRRAAPGSRFESRHRSCEGRCSLADARVSSRSVRSRSVSAGTASRACSPTPTAGARCWSTACRTDTIDRPEAGTKADGRIGSARERRRTTCRVSPRRTSSSGRSFERSEILPL